MFFAVPVNGVVCERSVMATLNSPVSPTGRQGERQGESEAKVERWTIGNGIANTGGKQKREEEYPFFALLGQ